MLPQPIGERDAQPSVEDQPLEVIGMAPDQCCLLLVQINEGVFDCLSPIEP